MNVKRAHLFKFDSRSLALFATVALASGLAAAQAQPRFSVGPSEPPKAEARTATAPDAPAAPAGTAFRKADTDGSGSISRQEADKAGGWADKFDQADANRDGALSQSEFYQAPK